MNNKSLKLIWIIAFLVANTVCCGISLLSGDANVFRIVGSYVAFLAVSVLLWRFPTFVQATCLAFVFLASPLGSVLGFYARFNYFDKFVHYLSGIVLAFLGFYIAKALLDKKQISDNGNFLKNTIAFLFSCSCAAFWEIYEFTVDNVLKMQSQGDNSNTMGDIVAGVLGAATYLVLYFIINKKNIKKQ